MIQNFRGKKTKDIESASDTILNNIGMTSNFKGQTVLKSLLNISSQDLNTDNFDSTIEKRNKEFK